MSATRVWRLPEVMTQTGLSRSTIYEMIGKGEFPRQFNLGPRAVGWSSKDVLAWVDSKICEPRTSDLGSNRDCLSLTAKRHP